MLNSGSDSTPAPVVDYPAARNPAFNVLRYYRFENSLEIYFFDRTKVDTFVEII